MSEKRFSRFEAAAQRLIEGSFSRFLGGRLEPQEIATQLARALEDSYATGQVGLKYVVHLHPRDYAKLAQKSPQLEDQLVAYLLELAQQENIYLADPPTVELTADDEMERYQVRVESEVDPAEADATQQYDFSSLGEALEAKRAIDRVDAFLILDGRRHLSITQPITSLGRHIDSDIIIDSPQISRKHAQIRWRYNRFVIYDLGSRFGTQVNGNRITECALHPGDVITLGDTTLIYGEGRTRGKPVKPERRSVHETQTRIELPPKPDTGVE